MIAGTVGQRATARRYPLNKRRNGGRSRTQLPRMRQRLYNVQPDRPDIRGGKFPRSGSENSRAVKHPVERALA